LLRIPAGELDDQVSLRSLGLDSLLAAKLRTTLARELGVEVPIRHILGPGSVSDLVSEVERRMPVSRSG
jgi:acyl carrier protein